jgi:DNA-binding transcriptional LysR family regulator
VLARASSAELVLADLAGLKVGSLRLAASQTVGNYWLPGIIHKFRSAYPGLSVELTMGNTETVAAMVRKGEANLGFVEGEVDAHALNVVPVADDDMALVVAPSHPWAAARDGEGLDLRTSPWVMREHGSGTRSILEAMLAARGHSLSDVEISLVLPTNESVRVAVESGAGATVMSRLAVANALTAGRLAAVDYPVPRRKFFMLRHSQHHETVAEGEFVRLVTQG